MDAWVFTAVLLAAALHAGWNTLVKSSQDQFASIALITTGALALAVLVLPFTKPLDTGVWAWLAASVALHVSYNLSLVKAYRAGDLGQVYPMARGTAPFLVSGVGAVFLGEWLTTVETAGMVVLLSGVWLMSLRGGPRQARIEGNAVTYALVTALFIAGYTLADGIGARLNGSATSYVTWLFMLDGLSMLIVYGAVQGRSALAALAAQWRVAATGGAMSFGAYWVAVWAMTRAPIALVAALRESSVLVAALISVAVLKEVASGWRVGATLVIVIGIVLLRIG